jgi:hypothetical protein
LPPLVHVSRRYFRVLTIGDRRSAIVYRLSSIATRTSNEYPQGCTSQFTKALWPFLLTISLGRVDGRLTMTRHTGGGETVAERVRRMSAQDPGQQDDGAEQSLASAIYRQEHCSYLLRLWRAGADGSWRASLQSIPSGERHMFADLESLVAFLFGLSQ